MLEFNKVTRRIILSHSRIFEDVQRAEQQKAKDNAAGAKKQASDIPAIQNQAATTSLGDLDALAKLKAQMESAPSAENTEENK